MMTDEHSNALFSSPILQASDFVLQPNGVMTYFGPNYLYYAIDSLGNILHTYGSTNGIRTDGHEFILKNDGSYIVLGSTVSSKNMSSYGGHDSATIEGGAIQTFDSSGNLIFEWRGIDHYNVQDDITPGDLKVTPIDFEHANSIDIDSEGNYLLSNRNLSEITKIDGATGKIIWRFGGKNNQFKLAGDALGISCQHYARWLKNGDILLFDNGVYHPVQESRAVEYDLDTNAMTATLKWQYRHTPALFAEVMGNAERLDNGNTFIGWGSEITVAATEVDPKGNVVYEMSLPGTFSYRALKYTPAAAPVSAPLGISMLQQPSGLSLSIKAAANGFEASVETSSVTDATLLIYDAKGRAIQHLFDGNIAAGARTFALPTAPLTSGVYYCHLYTSGGELTRPFLVTH